MNVGIAIRAHRLDKGYSQGFIEKHTGLLRCYISRVENGHTQPSLGTLARIAAALDVSVGELLYDSQLTQPWIQPMSDDELRFIHSVRRYSSQLTDGDRKLLLAMVKKFGSMAATKVNQQRGEIAAAAIPQT